MKRTSVLAVLALFVSLHSQAQESPSSEIAAITLPKNSLKISRKDALEFKDKKYKYLTEIKGDKNVYNVDGIIFSFRDIPMMDDDNITLLDQKAEMEAFYKKNGGKIVESRIVTINSASFFVFESKEGDERILSFTSDFKNRKTLICTCHYKESDEAKAKAIFDKIINNIRFK